MAYNETIYFGKRANERVRPGKALGTWVSSMNTNLLDTGVQLQRQGVMRCRRIIKPPVFFVQGSFLLTLTHRNDAWQFSTIRGLVRIQVNNPNAFQT